MALDIAFQPRLQVLLGLAAGERVECQRDPHVILAGPLCRGEQVVETSPPKSASLRAPIKHSALLTPPKASVSASAYAAPRRRPSSVTLALEPDEPRTCRTYAA